MEPILTIYDADMRPRADVLDYELDMAYGVDENDFTLTVNEPARPVVHGYIGILGTELGGVVDSVRSTRDGSTRRAVYSGRTWHGMMGGKVLCPDPGADHVTVEGEAGSVLASLIDRMGLSGVIRARTGSRLHVPRTDLDRFCTGWEGVRKALSAAGARLSLTLDGSRIVAEAVPVSTFTDDAGGAVGFDAKSDRRPVNHLVGLGSGELRDRVVTHWYADADGNVSKAQSLFGPDERAEVYDYSNAELAELDEKTRAKLAEMQGTSTASVEVEDADAGIGDTVTAHDDELGVEVSAEVTKIIAKVKNGVLAVERDTGDTARAVRLAETAEQSYATLEELRTVAQVELYREDYR